MANKFWMVWRSGDRPPSKAHATEVDACNEARRLAEANPNNDFFVLESRVCYRGDITVSSSTCAVSTDQEGV